MYIFVYIYIYIHVCVFIYMLERYATLPANRVNLLNTIILNEYLCKHLYEHRPERFYEHLPQHRFLKGCCGDVCRTAGLDGNHHVFVKGVRKGVQKAVRNGIHVFIYLLYIHTKKCFNIVFILFIYLC